MRIERAVRTLLGAVALCSLLAWLLASAGCSGGTTSTSSSDPVVTPQVNAAPRADWGYPLLAGGTVGVGQFPAKFTFDVNATRSCTNDFVVYNTSLAGVTPTAAATRTGTFTGVAVGSVTISSPERSIILTASTDEIGPHFLNTGGNTAEATSLAAAINRTDTPGLDVTASSASATVTVTANSNGAEGNLITLGSSIPNFTWAGATLTGGLGKGNIVAFNRLYSTQGSDGGTCDQDGPSVYWSYFTGMGTAVTSVVLSGDGTKVAFVENVGGTATLRILRWKAGQGNGAGYPVAPDNILAAGSAWSTCAASCIRSIAFSGAAATDTGSPPFYNYNTDTLYVGDDSSRVHKFTGVFNGTPAEVVVSWPITVNGTAKLTGPVFDGVSKNIFVGDSTGRLSFIREVGSTVGACGSGSPPCLGLTNQSVGTGGAIVDAPIVDGTTGMVFAVNGTETGFNGVIVQAPTTLASKVTFDMGGNAAGANLYGGAFDNTYFNSAIPNKAGHMYVCGKDTAFNNRPAIYQLSFAAATGVLTSVGTPLTGLVSASGPACSPVTEFDNTNGAGPGTERDWIFFSIGDLANTVDPIPTGSACRTDTNGCVISINVTGNPTWPPTTVTNTASVFTNTAGSTSGIVVDNVSTSSQASNFYFSLGTNSTAGGPGVPACNTTAGVGCAVKLTQSGLQ